MVSRRLIGVDVDQVLLEPPWLDWLSNRSDNCGYMRCHVEISSGNADYDLSTYFPDVEDPYNFWRNLDYTGLKPYPQAFEKLRELSQYFGIVFISTVKGNHNKSKYYWVKKNAPFMEGFLATKEKYLMNDSLVAMIDDRLKNLKGFDGHKRVLFKTPYRQEEEFKDMWVPTTIYSWDKFSVEDFCERYL